MDIPEEAEPLLRTTETHETWVEKLIVDAQERGLFNNLSTAGKPLTLERAPYAGDMELGYGILKNAGFSPLWVEIDKGIRAQLETMTSIRERAAALSRSGTDCADESMMKHTRRRSWWKWFFGITIEPGARRRLEAKRLTDELNALRQDYLARAAKVDTQIELFNATVPRSLWWVERPRLTPERAASEFDDAITGPASDSST